MGYDWDITRPIEVRSLLDLNGHECYTKNGLIAFSIRDLIETSLRPPMTKVIETS